MLLHITEKMALEMLKNNWLHAANQENIQKEHAVNAIIKHINEENEKGNEVGIFTIGPMSNLAMAIKLDPKLPSKISKFYAMGGTANAFGNVTLSGEFNFHYDPEAAHICIKEMPKVHLLVWEAAYIFDITKEGRLIKKVNNFIDEKRLLKDSNELVKLFGDINGFNKNDTVDGRIYA